jgi:hypothetical protein
VLRHLNKQQKSGIWAWRIIRQTTNFRIVEWILFFSLLNFKDQTDNQSDVKTFLYFMEPEGSWVHWTRYSIIETYNGSSSKPHTLFLQDAF